MSDDNFDPEEREELHQLRSALKDAIKFTTKTRISAADLTLAVDAHVLCEEALAKLRYLKDILDDMLGYDDE